MNNITVKSLIQSNYPTLHQAEKKVADYILSHAHEVVNYSVTELSEKSHASEATIVRTCKKLGYQGYYHLKIALAKEVINPDNSYPDNTDFTDITSLATFLLKKQAEDLIQSTQFFNAEVLESILKLLANCDTIFFFAAGNSNPLAVYGAYKFSQLGLKTVVHVSPEMQINAAYSMGKRDLAIGISNSGSTNLITILNLRYQNSPPINSIPRSAIKSSLKPSTPLAFRQWALLICWCCCLCIKTRRITRNTAPVKSFSAPVSRGKRSSFHPLCRFSCSVAHAPAPGHFPA